MSNDLPLIFCNIGWMSNYEGIKGKPDKIVGGGKWVEATGSGGECCNFLVVDGNKVYGHVETIHGETDRQIGLKALDPQAGDAAHAHVIWTATHPDERGRRVVGWYKNATVYRERQKFERYPSAQHALDEVGSYRIVALAEGAHVVPLHDRSLRLGRGPGWMGHNPWWYPKSAASPEIEHFILDVRTLLDGSLPIDSVEEQQVGARKKSPSPTADGYPRYTQEYEIRISPRHHILQKRFTDFLAQAGVRGVQENVSSVDLTFSYGEQTFLVEVKPCDQGDTRFAIRAAMGQLLDYEQKWGTPTSRLIVVEQLPNELDQELALSNSFGIAYPTGDTFAVKLPHALPNFI